MSPDAQPEKPTIDIDLVSDVVCPWCPIGYAHLQQALAMVDDVLDCRLRWHPFVLNPDLPAEGRDLLEHLTAKYGRSEAEMRASQDQIVTAARACGLDFSHATERRSWNTFDVHRVLAYARDQDCDTAFNQALFKAYFDRAENPTDRGLLRDTASALGLDADEIDTILDGDAYRAEVEAEIAEAQRAGVSSVPAFIIDGQYLLEGAQPPADFAEALRRIAAQKTAEA